MFFLQVQQNVHFKWIKTFVKDKNTEPLRSFCSCPKWTSTHGILCNQTHHTEMLPRCCGTKVDLTAFFNIRWCSLWRLKDVFVSLFYVRLGHKNGIGRKGNFVERPLCWPSTPVWQGSFGYILYHFIEGLWILPPACTDTRTHRHTYKYIYTYADSVVMRPDMFLLGWICRRNSQG